MEEKNKILEQLLKEKYELGRKLFELKVAKELTRDKDKLKDLELYIKNTTNELKIVSSNIAEINLEKERGIRR